MAGTLSEPASARVAWAHTFPGELTSPPAVRLGPAGELIANVATHDPDTSMGYASDEWLMRLDADTGALRWVQEAEPLTGLTVDTQGNILFVLPTGLQKLDPDGHLLWSRASPTANAYKGVLALDGDDNILIARVEITPSDSEEEDPKGSIRLEQFDADGNPRWVHLFGDGTIPLAHAYLTLNRDNSVLLLASETPWVRCSGPAALSLTLSPSSRTAAGSRQQR